MKKGDKRLLRATIKGKHSTGYLCGPDGVPVSYSVPGPEGQEKKRRAPELHEVPVTMEQAHAVARQWLGLDDGDERLAVREINEVCQMRFEVQGEKLGIEEPKWWYVLRSLQAELLRRGLLEPPEKEEEEP